jgi:DNA repair exonuclease SbcCD ATPase subunit
MTNAADAAKQKSDAQSGLQAIKDHERTLKAARDEYQAAVLKVKELKDEVNPYEATIASIRAQAEAIAEEIKKSNRDKDALFKEMEAISDAAKVFSPAGVRAYILDTVTPFLNDRTAHYLSILSDGNLTAQWSTLNKLKSGEIREKFAITVSSVTGGETFNLISGGEKRKVRLACSMALQDLVASRASKPFDLYIADEIDDAVDASGLERLMSILESKARERGTVLVISHNSLNDWIRESVKVVKSGGFAKIEGDSLEP